MAFISVWCFCESFLFWWSNKSVDHQIIYDPSHCFMFVSALQVSIKTKRKCLSPGHAAKQWYIVVRHHVSNKKWGLTWKQTQAFLPLGCQQVLTSALTRLSVKFGYHRGCISPSVNSASLLTQHLGFNLQNYKWKRTADERSAWAIAINRDQWSMISDCWIIHVIICPFVVTSHMAPFVFLFFIPLRVTDWQSLNPVVPSFDYLTFLHFTDWRAD